MKPKKKRETPRAARQVLYTVVAVVAGLCLIEGISSLSLGVYDFARNIRRPLAERRHTTYDAELGWVNRPSTHLKDLYGPGRSLAINRQGFRATHEFTKGVPPGRVRVIGSGDSFTLGFGVDDADTWCARLEALDPRFEVVNMGQGGYGVDQIYLWYERDGRRLDHQIHVFAFITNDFQRMRYDRFLGYGKPTLKLVDGVPVADGVPVPRRSFWVPWWTQNAALFHRFRTVQLLERALGRSGDREGKPVLDVQQSIELAFRALLTTHRRDAEHGSTLLVVWLPLQSDYRNRADDGLREQFLGALRAEGIPAVDLVEPMRRLDPGDVERMFLTSLPKGTLTGFVNADLHYSAAGNAFIAQGILQAIRSRPEGTASGPAAPSAP